MGIYLLAGRNKIAGWWEYICVAGIKLLAGGDICVVGIYLLAGGNKITGWQEYICVVGIKLLAGGNIFAWQE